MNDRVALGKVEFPAYLKGTDELPHPIQDVPLWSENYFTQAYDPAKKVGFFFHFSRTPFNPNVWEGVFTCYLPGDRALVARDFSWDSNPEKGPGSNAQRFEVIEPFKKISKRFRGAAQLIRGDQMRSGALPDDSHVFVDVDLTWNGSGPVFDIGGTDMGTQFWAHFHYEQFGDVTGSVSFDGSCLGLGKENYDFNGMGFRDHSMGRRDVVPMANHNWFAGKFPSGRQFMVMDLRLKNGPPFTYIVVGDKTGYSRFNLVSKAPLLDDLARCNDPYEIQLEGANGERHLIKAELLQTLPYSFNGPNEWVLGVHPTAHHVLNESMTRFEWDGEVGYGLTERSVVLK